MAKDIFYDGQVITSSKDLKITTEPITGLNRARNILKTVKGEYLYNSDLGVNLQDYVGGPASKIAMLQNYLREELKENGLNITSVVLSSLKDRVLSISIDINGNVLEVSHANNL